MKEHAAISSRQRILFSLILLLLVLAVTEAMAAAGTWFLVKRHLMAYIPAFSDAQIAHFFEHREPRLGWGPPTDSTGLVHVTTPRPDPASAPGAPACISVYGDSFTFGDDVGPDQSYPHHLATLAGCRVDNFGLGGYGSDQALMLHRAQSRVDSAPVTVLGHLSENILRNVNQYRQLLYPGSELYFKPRFLLEGDSLRYVPIAVQRAEDFHRLRQNPREVLAHEGIINRPRRSFPHTIALVRWMIGDFKVQARFRREPYERSFYDSDHPAGGLALTDRILTSFVKEARARGQRPLVLLIPTRRDLEHAQESAQWVDQPLADELKAAGIPVLHVGPILLENLGGESPCAIFAGCTQHHFDSRGNRMIAEAVWQRVGEERAGGQ